MKLSRIIFLLIFLFTQYALRAQDNADLGYNNYHSTFQLWPSVKISKDFKHGVSANAQYVMRADVINPSIEGHYFYLSVKYKAFKFLQPDFQFRGVNTPQKNLYRFEFGVKARYKYKDWTFGYRTAYFHENEYFARSYEHGHFPTNYWRNRLELRWDFKKNWGAYVTAEAYTLFEYRGINVRRVAFIGGIEYAFKKMHSINLYYMAQPDFSSKYPDAVHALALVYCWDIPDSFKKKKKKK